MSPLSNAERQRRKRAKAKSAADPVGAYLRAVIGTAEQERATGTMTATTRRLAAIAARLLSRPATIAHSPWETFARRYGITAAFAREASVEATQAAVTLRWAHDEVLGGRADPRAVREGLRAARTLAEAGARFDERAVQLWFARTLSGVAGGIELAPPELCQDEGDEA